MYQLLIVSLKKNNVLKQSHNRQIILDEMQFYCYEKLYENFC